MKKLLMCCLTISVAACGDSTTPADGASPGGDPYAVADVQAGVDTLGAAPAVDAGTIVDNRVPDAVNNSGGPVDVIAPSPDAGGPAVTPDTTPDPPVEPEADTSVPDNTEPEDEPEPLGGGILLFELASDMLNQAGAGGRFTDPVELLDPNAEVYGLCAVTDADPNAPEADPLVGYDAGTITIGGTTPSVTLTPVDEGAFGTGYASGLSEDLESILPGGGALLNVSAEGGDDIPAFTMYIQVPEPVTLTAPATGLFAGAPASSPLNVAWNQGSGDAVLVTFTPLSATFQQIAGKGLVCTQSGDLGSLTVPVEALQAVKSSGVSKVAIGVTRMRTSTTNAGPWEVPAVVTRSSGGLLGLD